MSKWIYRIFALTLLFVVAMLSGVYFLFGGGEPYPDLSTSPILPDSALEVVVESEKPIGNVAVSEDGRVFYTVHPEANLDGPKLYEWINGESVPYPNAEVQDSLFISPLGVAVDALARLWVIDPANHGTSSARLIAFDLTTNEVTYDHSFQGTAAPIGSFLQDLQISTDGRWIYIADVGFWAKRPAFVTHDTKTGNSHRALNRHASVYPQNLLIRNQIKDMSFFGGLLEMKTGLDGIALSRDNQWIYYGAMNHDTLYRVPAKALQDRSLNDAEIAEQVEAIGKKPLNDGFSIDDNNNVFITDIEHQAVIKMAPDGELETLVRDKRIRWADSLSFGPDGWLYLADSAIPHIALQSAEHIKSQAPYYIWRFKPGTTGAAGQ